MSLPNGWPVVTLGEVAETQLGKMLSMKAKTGIGTRPYLRNVNVQWGRIDVHDLVSMDFSEKDRRRFRLHPGDLLVCEGGEIGRAALWRGDLEECYYQKALHRVRTGSSLLPEFLLYYIRHLANTDGFAPFVTGSTIRHLPQEDLRTIPVPTPPVDQQREIVEEIEKQFTRLDAGEESLRGSLQRLGSFQRSALQALLGGDGSWEATSLADLGDFYDGHTPKGADTRVDPRGTTPWFKVKDMNTPGNERWMRVAPNRLTNAAVAEHGFRVMPSGTIIFPKLGGAVATNKKRILVEPSCCDLNTMGFRPRENMEGYMWLWFKEVDLATMAQGSVVPQLRKRELAALPVHVPPASFVKDAVSEGERLLSLKDELAQEIGAARRLSARLRMSILTRAFSGELVRPTEAMQT